MPRQRKTAEQLMLTGAMHHDSKRYADRLLNPKPEHPIGDAPAHWSNPDTEPDDKKANALKILIWDEVISIMPTGVLGNSDRITVELAVNLIYRMRFGFWSKASEMTTLLNTLSRLGMTPQDRTKLHLDKPAEKEDDPWADLLKQ